jgi:hypothetical protein
VFAPPWRWEAKRCQRWGLLVMRRSQHAGCFLLEVEAKVAARQGCEDGFQVNVGNGQPSSETGHDGVPTMKDPGRSA